MNTKIVGKKWKYRKRVENYEETHRNGENIIKKIDENFLGKIATKKQENCGKTTRIGAK